MNSIIENIPVQNLLRNVFETTIGASPSVTVSEPVESMENFYDINIFVDDINMAISLAIITIPVFTYSGVTISVNYFVDNCSQPVSFPELLESSSIGTLVELVDTAFSDNPFYVYSAAPTNSLEHNQDFYLVFVPHVLQYTCDNPQNLFGSCSFVASDLFKVVLSNDFFNLFSVGFSTDLIS